VRRDWWFAIGGGISFVAVAVVASFIVFGSDGGGNDAVQGCPPAPSTASAGNALISGQALGKGFNRRIVLHVTDKKSGAPLRHATVSVQATMTCPHVMPLYQKDLREASTGTYEGDYGLIMPGQWTFNIVVRSQKGDATTSALPVRVKAKPGS
jgi:hypothetical protein